MNLTSKYQAGTEAIRNSLTKTLKDSFHSLPNYRDKTVHEFIDDIIPIIEGSQQSMIALTEEYMSQKLGTPVTVDLDKVMGEVLRNEDPHQVYERVAHQVWYGLSEGKPLDEAIKMGWTRLQSLATTDLQRSKQLTSYEIMRGQNRRPMWQRVTSNKSCALCALAATRRYWKEDLLPIHPGCNCSVEPVAGVKGHVIDQDRVDEIHSIIEEQTGNSNFGGRGYSDIIIKKDHQLGESLEFRKKPQDT